MQVVVFLRSSFSQHSVCAVSMLTVNAKQLGSLSQALQHNSVAASELVLALMLIPVL
jgi:hypothetical protein